MDARKDYTCNTHTEFSQPSGKSRRRPGERKAKRLKLAVDSDANGDKRGALRSGELMHFSFSNSEKK